MTRKSESEGQLPILELSLGRDRGGRARSEAVVHKHRLAKQHHRQIPPPFSILALNAAVATMDHDSLRTASTYLNNLLLARGLLRNSEPIDFVKPSKESRAQIINLVHDLILREDRDREQREHVAVTIRTLRVEETRKNVEIEKLNAKNAETSRALAQAQAAERAAQAEVKRMEKLVKGLQDQIGKLKTAMTQVRTQCTNDVRKRDLEIARLKTHLQGQQRGNKVGVSAPSITITGGTRKTAMEGTAHDLDDPEYSLKQETTEFLTQLSQSLSDENDNLINLIRGALSTMRELLGLPAMAHRHPDSAIGSIDSHEDIPTGKQDTNSANMLHPLATSHQTLSTTMEATLTHLKSILTNPNFVSMDEVVMRDEEIARLRFGWERMELRWKDVLHMMEAWKRKMDTGHTINIDDLRRGIGLVSPETMGKSVMGPVREEEEGDSFVNGEVSEIKLPGGSNEDESSLLVEAPQPEVKRSPKRKRDVLEPPEFFDLRPSSHKASPEPLEDLDEELAHDSPSGDEEVEVPRMTIAEKLDRARTEAERAAAAAARTQSTSAQQPKLSSAQTSKSSSKTSRLPRPTINGAASLGFDGAKDNTEGDDTLGKLPQSPVVAKRAGIRGRPKKRRKSTLSPEELEELIASGDV